MLIEGAYYLPLLTGQPVTGVEFSLVMFPKALPVAILLAALAGCGHATPAAPDSAVVAVAPVPAPVAVSLGAATPMSPQDGTTLPPDTTSVVLTSSNPVQPAGRIVFHTFEIASDPSFAAILESATVLATGGTVSYAFTKAKQGQHYVWRVRSASGELVSANSVTVNFAVTPASGVAAPQLFEPADGAIQSARPIINIASALTDPALGAVSLHLDIARDAAFSSVYVAMDKAQSTSSLTNFRLSSDAPAGEYFYRARATAGGVVGPWSSTRRFTVGGPFVGMPTHASPLNGSMIPSPRVTMTIANAEHSGNASAATYWFQISRTEDFASPFFYVGATQIQNRSTSMQSSELAPGTYYWRVQTRVSGDFATPVSSAWTQPWRFVVAPEAIQAPVPVSPATGATVYAQPTLTVTNAVRTGGGGALSYRFELTIGAPNSGNDFADGYMVATATVPESATGQTTWTVPAELVPGQRYRWRVLVTDPSTGIEAPAYADSSFWAVTAAARLFVLDIELPSTCKTGANSSSYYATSTSLPGAATFVLTTLSTLELRWNGTTGTIVGGSRVIGKSYTASIAAVRNTTTPAALAGSVNADGTGSGTFDGDIVFTDSFDGGGSCKATGIRWTIRSRF